MNLERKWNNASLQFKLTMSFAITVCVIILVNMVMYVSMNHMMGQIEDVYASNVNLNELSDALQHVQDSMRDYLDTKGSDTLDNYYRADQQYRDYLSKLNQDVKGSPAQIMEKNIFEQSETYLDVVFESIQSKRGRNVEQYRTEYEQASIIYADIKNSIFSLNNELFKNNTENYMVLLSSIRTLEMASTVILLFIGCINMISILSLTRNLIRPLEELSRAAYEIGAGNFETQIAMHDTEDEIGVVSRAFRKMTVSIQKYIGELKESMERESQMKEKELLMDSRMREAELRTLQAQINPHFLFNTLNAGAQLAMLEGADKTTEFIENMAEFFRYNIKKMNQDATIEDEVRLVDNYVYILNVRFTGEIHYSKRVSETVLNYRVPSMILQPIIENAVNYGIRDIDWEGWITLEIDQRDEFIYLSVKDNGIGITQEKISQILNGELENRPEDKNSGSNGIGIGNVIERLRIYTGREDVMEIRSEGENLGTEVIIKVPVHV